MPELRAIIATWLVSYNQHPTLACFASELNRWYTGISLTPVAWLNTLYPAWRIVFENRGETRKTQKSREEPWNGITKKEVILCNIDNLFKTKETFSKVHFKIYNLYSERIFCCILYGNRFGIKYLLKFVSLIASILIIQSPQNFQKSFELW